MCPQNFIRLRLLIVILCWILVEMALIWFMVQILSDFFRFFFLLWSIIATKYSYKVLSGCAWPILKICCVWVEMAKFQFKVRIFTNIYILNVIYHSYKMCLWNFVRMRSAVVKLCYNRLEQALFSNIYYLVENIQSKPSHCRHGTFSRTVKFK
jgi:hypothetical protein